MRLHEFKEQEEYCRANKTPDGSGCAGCPAVDKEHCADALVTLCSQWLQAIGTDGFDQLSGRLDQEYGLKPYNQLALCRGVLELEE
ncbi:MAG: hypothetical protein JRD89_02860 [Deltaproteobacteria bacterium]|nr:hypothetical protein [Deltaproteobacteria bacterium]